MFVYKVDVLQELKNKGFSTYVLRNNGILGNASITKLNKGIVLGINDLEKICSILKCQPGYLIKWEPNKEPGKESWHPDRKNASPGKIQEPQQAI